MSALSNLSVFLTYLPLVPHICVDGLDQHWFRQWPVAYSAPSQYLSQCSLIVNWPPRNKLKWNSNQNTKLSIQENAFGIVVCKMIAILSRGWLKVCMTLGVSPLGIISVSLTSCVADPLVSHEEQNYSCSIQRVSVLLVPDSFRSTPHSSHKT